ncbi:very short patch repair endonuclease [Intrasporangium sp. YIM S08009]|uniref:very short patch repair endonuclease n=1 Tax=Intrasporangium zincisolvens TaxID=3080018 RepID=UPI002B052007|nr:very short patch repair endonuclease [Intrasporangium sp. YIM S08009]
MPTGPPLGRPPASRLPGLATQGVKIVARPEEPIRSAPTASLSARFAAQRREDTKPEVELRRRLHALGLRYRVHFLVPGLPRRRVDIAFTRSRVAVQVDGCFWHGCPEHCVIPATNKDWWLWKFSVNSERDRDTDRRLAELGWTALHIWEHESPEAAADRVLEALGMRPPAPSS